MAHRLIGTDAQDFGSQCLTCGAAFDADTERALDIIESLVPCQPNDGDPHHWVAIGTRWETVAAECHYCGTEVNENTLPADVPATCPAER